MNSQVNSYKPKASDMARIKKHIIRIANNTDQNLNKIEQREATHNDSENKVEKAMALLESSRNQSEPFSGKEGVYRFEPENQLFDG